jgi:hypothetical protein
MVTWEDAFDSWSKWKKEWMILKTKIGWASKQQTQHKLQQHINNYKIKVENWSNKWSGPFNRPHKEVTEAKGTQKMTNLFELPLDCSFPSSRCIPVFIHALTSKISSSMLKLPSRGFLALDSIPTCGSNIWTFGFGDS